MMGSGWREVREDITRGSLDRIMLWGSGLGIERVILRDLGGGGG